MNSDMYESPLARSLAFTALLDVSPEFRRTPMAQGSQDITEFIEDHRALVAEYGLKMGVTDMHTYAKTWAQSHYLTED